MNYNKLDKETMNFLNIDADVITRETKNSTLFEVKDGEANKVVLDSSRKTMKLSSKEKNILRINANATINKLRRDLKYKKDGSQLDEKFYSTNLEVILNDIDIIENKIFLDTFSGDIQFKDLYIPGPISVSHIGNYDDENNIRVNKDKITVQVVSSIRLFLETYYNLVATSINTAERLITNTIYNIASENKINLVKKAINELDGLWDGEERLDTFYIDNINAENNKLNERLARATFMSIIQIILHPGYNLPFHLAIYGKQGVGKTTLIRKISQIPTIKDKALIDSLTAVISDKINTNAFVEKVKNIIIMIDEEGSFMKNNTIEDNKAMVTAEYFEIQRKYKNETDIIPKHFIPIVLTNNLEYIDATGGRRDFPIEMGATANEPSETLEKVIKLVERKDDYLLQVYAEAYEYLKALNKKGKGEFQRVINDLGNDFRDRVKEKTATSLEEDDLSNYIEMPVPLDYYKYNEEKQRDYVQAYKIANNPNVVKIANKYLGQKYNNDSRFMYQEYITMSEIKYLLFNEKLEKGLNYKIRIKMENDSRFVQSKSLGIKSTKRGWKRNDDKKDHTFKVWISGEVIEESILTKKFINSNAFNEKEDTPYDKYMLKDGDKGDVNKELDHLETKKEFTQDEIMLFKNKYKNILSYIYGPFVDRVAIELKDEDLPF